MRLRDYLQETGQSENAFAEKAELPASTINRVAAGKVMPRRTTRDRIVRASGGRVTLEGLLKAYADAHSAGALA